MATTMETRRRVKLYQLDDEGKWEDKGTGQIACNFIEQKGSVYLIVKSEDDGSVILESKVCTEDIYQRQQATLIVWTDPETNIDLALSFQEADGCQDIWDQIVAVQQKAANDASVESDSENNDGSDESSMLPPANINNVDAILETIVVNSTPAKRDRFVLALIKEEYIRKLLQLFTLCEDFEDKPVLHAMFNIFKNLILLNDTNLMEILFSDEYMIQVMGVLEYDPDISESNRMKHREFLTNSALFKQVIPFTSNDLVEKIHQTFRMQYLKDVVLNRVLDDPTFATINSLIFFNNVEIVTQLQNDPKFIGDIFTKLKSDTLTTPQRRDVLLFIHEMCNLAKNLQIPNRIQFYKTLTEQGLFDVITTALSDENVATRMACTDILNLTLSHDPSLLRGFTAHQAPNYPLLKSLVDSFTKDPEIGVKSQCAEILKILLDTDAVGEEPGVKDEFLNVFYQHFIKVLVERLKKKYDLPNSRYPSQKANGKKEEKEGEKKEEGEKEEKKEEKDEKEKETGEEKEKEKEKPDEKMEGKKEEKEPPKEQAKGEGASGDGEKDKKEGKEEEKGGKECVMGRADLAAGFVQNNVCEMLSYCIRHHGYRIKYFLLGGNAVQKVLKLLDHKDTFLVLAAIRFFRTFVGANDDFYNRHIIKHNLFAPIVRVFERNGPKYNLLNSAVLELFDYVRRENVKLLIPYVVEQFGDTMRKVEYVDVFKQLLSKYEQMQELETRKPGASGDKMFATNGPIRKTKQQVEEEDEENYFKGEEEVGAAAKDTKPKEDVGFREMPKKEKEDDSLRFKELTKKPKADTPRKFKEAEPERKFKEGEPRKFKEAEPRKFKEAESGEGRIKFKLGDVDHTKHDEASKPPTPPEAGGLGLVDYGSDEEEHAKSEEEKREGGEGMGNGQVRERTINGDSLEPASKRLKVMDDREEFPRTPPVST